MKKKLVAIATAVVFTVAPITAASCSAAVAPVVTETSLTPTALTAGQSAKATLVVHSTGKVAAQAVTVAVRDKNGNNVDFPGGHSATINGDYTFTSGAKSFPAGSYTEFGSYEVSGSWHPLASKTLVVSPVVVTPPPVTPPPTTPPVTPPPTTPPAGPVGVPGSWTAQFDDEFNGTALNASVWQPGWFGTGLTGPVNSSEPHKYSSANVSESGGTLNLALTATNGSLVSTNPDALGTGKGYQFSGPSVLEARVFVPGSGTTVSNWPAFWSDGQSWPSNGEIDVMEGLGGGTAYHVHTNAGGPGQTVNVGSGWHTFAADWSGNTMTFYYDGKNVGSEPYSTGNAPQYILFDNSSYGPDGTTPSVMQVDWVKVWKPA